MADEGKPPAGRGSSGPGRGSQRKAKFAPTVPSQRRRKADEGAGAAGASATAAEAAAANQAFQDLIRAAQTESKWQRGRGRGFGRGRGAAATTVMFGGDGSSDGRRTAALPQPRAAPKPKGEANPGVKADGAASSSKRRLKPNAAKPEDGTAAADGAGTSQSKPRSRHHADGSDGSDSEGAQELSSLFDYEQYFPTTLPLPLHHPCDEEADTYGDAAVMRHGLPEELALREDDPEGDTATQLGLTDLATAADTLFLFQLPSLLPLGVPPAPPAAAADGRKGRGAAAAAAAAAAGGGGASSSAAAAAAAGSSRQQLRAAGARELPSGPIGKLLVFKSGRVKLEVGSCLLDVSAGMPVVSRQDVAAINKSTGHLIQLGPVTQRAVVCPDVWQLMANQEVPDFRRDLQQQSEGLTNGFGRGEGAMEVDRDGEEGLEDEGVVVGGPRGAGRVKQQQQVLGSEEEESEEGEGSERQPGVKAEQQQQKQQQQQPKRLVQQLDTSSEDGSPEPAAAAAGNVKQEAPAAAAAAGVPPRQPAQQQQQQPAGNGALGWLELPSARAPAAGRGRGKFRPTTRSPSPGAAAMAAAAAGSGGVKHEDAMDVDS